MNLPALVTLENGDIVIRIRPSLSSAPAPADRLIRLRRQECQGEGLELAGLRALVDAGALPLVLVGRVRHVRFSDILALAKGRPFNAPPTVDVDGLNEARAAFRQRRAARPKKARARG